MSDDPILLSMAKLDMGAIVATVSIGSKIVALDADMCRKFGADLFTLAHKIDVIQADGIAVQTLRPQ